ncbi:MAG: flagellar biosynthesis repressor FlbT [Desulfuromonadaceae bacterium]|nr:flagellar biosynthesis repressor FlbT [Desulfuromonadaceae bacterium]
MPLKLTLKPGERIIVGGAVLTNGSTAANLLVENRVPILRQNDILTEAKATTPCKQVYLIVQLMYIDGLTSELAQMYWDLARDILTAAPSTNGLISQISAYILETNFYLALKAAKKLIFYEEELIKNASELS